MADILQYFDGVVVAQFQLYLPDQTVQELTSNTVTHHSSTLSDSAFGAACYEHRFAATQTDFAERLLRQAMSSVSPRLRFRLGSTRNSTTDWMPWQEHIITFYVIIPEGTGTGSGHHIQIQTSDALYRLNRSTQTRCRKGRISDIVAAIAQENGIKDTVIEETETGGVYYQVLQGDADFVAKRLAPRSTNKKGFANYLFFFQDGALHFHTPDYHASVRSVDFYGVGGTLLTASDSSQKTFDLGGAGVSLIRYDPYTGHGVELTSNPERSLKYASTLYPIAQVPHGALNIPYHTGDNGDKEAIAIAQSTYDAARAGTFQTTFTLKRLAAIQVGDLLDLNLASGNARASCAGWYFVSQIVRRLEDGQITSLCTIQRGETTSLGSRVEVQGKNELVSELQAPGQFPSLSEVQGSVVGRGAGKHTSDRTFTAVSDANSGPFA